MDGARDSGWLSGQTIGRRCHLFQCLRATCEVAFGCVSPAPGPRAGLATACAVLTTVLWFSIAVGSRGPRIHSSGWQVRASRGLPVPRRHLPRNRRSWEEENMWESSQRAIWWPTRNYSCQIGYSIRCGSIVSQNANNSALARGAIGSSKHDAELRADGCGWQPSLLPPRREHVFMAFFLVACLRPPTLDGSAAPVMPLALGPGSSDRGARRIRRPKLSRATGLNSFEEGYAAREVTPEAVTAGKSGAAAAASRAAIDLQHQNSRCAYQNRVHY
jgi:hypothetical protein